MKAISTRRSIRRYKADPVDDKTLKTVLEAARQAPSWANTQCWRFIVVRGSNIKAELSGTLREANPALEAIKDAPMVIVACAELGKAGYLHRKPDPATDRGNLPKKPEPATDKGDWYMFDVALAMQNLVLAAHSLGLGTVHVGSFNAKRAAIILELPEGYCVVEMTPLGYPDQIRDPRPRKDLSEIVYYDKWGH
jgi:nitroreductase